MQVNFLSMIERKKSVRQTAFKSQGKILVHPGYKGLPFDGYPRPMLENQLWPIRKFFLPQLAVPSRGEERERKREREAFSRITFVELSFRLGSRIHHRHLHPIKEGESQTQRQLVCRREENENRSSSSRYL